MFEPNNHSAYKIGWKDIPEDIKKQVKGIVEERYPFTVVDNEVRQVDEWERMSNNFRVKVSGDGNESEVILRKHIALHDEKSIELQTRILSFLAEESFPVPHVIPAEGKKDFIFLGSNYYQMFKFISGDHYRGSHKELEEVARYIARLHKKFSHIPFFDDVAQKPKYLTGWTAQGWNTIFDIVSDKKTYFDATIMNYKNLILDSMRAIGSVFAKDIHVPVQVVRNSLHPHDTLFENETLKAILDFEEVNVGERVRDVANACHRFVRQFAVHHAIEHNEPWQKTLPEGIRIFMDAYIKENSLDPEEMRFFPLFIKDELLRKLFRDISRYCHEGKSEKLEGGELEKKLGLLEESLEIEKAFKLLFA